MKPSLSVARVDPSAQVVRDGNDEYTSSLVGLGDYQAAAPIAYIRVGRTLQPIGIAGFHVGNE